MTPSDDPPPATDLRRRKLTRYFEVHDLDGDGRIELADFDRVAENLRTRRGLPADAPAVAALRSAYRGFWSTLQAAADTDGDGGVDLEEWLAHWDRVLADDRRYQAEVAEVLHRLFALFDQDRTAAIEADEFCDFHAAHGLSPAFARSVFMDLDDDGDGAVDWTEFLEMAHAFYLGDDPGAAGNRLFGPLEG